MATNEELHQIGQTGFEAIDKFFGRSSAVLASEAKRSLYNRNEVPLKTIPSPYMVYQRTEISQVPDQLYAPPPPPEPPRNFPFSHFFPSKQQKRMGERRDSPPLGPYQVLYPPQELYGNRPRGWVPAAEASTIDNIMAAQLYGGITRVDYGWYK